MPNLKRLCCLCLFGLCVVSCESKEQPKAATQTETDPIEVQEAAREEPKLSPPPGEPGPFLVRLTEAFPTQIFATAATPQAFALAMQSDLRDLTLCPQTQLPVCFGGFAVIAERTNPNHPKVVKLYESDTQSGSRVDSVAASSTKFAFALNEGQYVGDDPTFKLVVVNRDAVIEREMALDLPDVQLSQVVLKPLEDGRILACKSFVPQASAPGIQCEKVDLDTGGRAPVGTISTRGPVRGFDVAVSGERMLAVWNDSGLTQVAYLNEPNDKKALGPSTALKPHVAAGMKDFAVVWQGDHAQTMVDRVPNAPLKNFKRQTLVLNGLDHRSISGLVAISDGFLFAFRHQNTPQVALISLAFDGWDLLSNSHSWRMLSDYASLDIQEAHSGKVVWQTAQSLVGHAM